MIRRAGASGTWHGVLVALLALGALAALSVAVPRWRSEMQHRTVELVLDAASVADLAARTGAGVEALLSDLRQAGATTLAVAEWTLADAVRAGQVALVRPEELTGVAAADEPVWLQQVRSDFAAHGPGGAETFYVAWQPDRLAPLWAERLMARLRSVGGAPVAEGEVAVWRVPQPSGGPRNVLGVLTLGLGFHPEQIAQAVRLGFYVALRPLDAPGVAPADVALRLAALDGYEAARTLVIFDGARVPGDPLTRQAWAGGLAAAGVPAAWIEFAHQEGLAQLICATGYAAVRLHSIAAPELHGLAPERAIARWRRAVQERSVRALYVRVYTEAPPGAADAFARDPVGFNLAYIDGIVRALRGAGYTLGRSVPPALPPVGRPALAAMGAAVGVAAVWLLRRFWRPPLFVEAAGVAGLAALAAASPGYTGRQLAALAAAVLFPALGTLCALDGAAVRPGRRAAWAAVEALLRATGVSLLGALFVAGLLSETPFALGLDLFLGVKAMHVAPPVLVFGAVLWERPVDKLRSVPGRAAALLRTPVPLWYAAAVCGAGALALLVVLRTGTDLLPVPGLEQVLREGLEQLLGVRPRNKEFLLGHPALVATAYLLLRSRLSRPVLGVLAAVASVGQLSLVNTFAHIHAPLWVSLLRTVYGVAFGAVLGLVLVGAAAAARTLTARRARGRGGEAPCA